MPTIRIETQISAPIEACFDAARDMGLHVLSAKGSGERIVAGRTNGLLELGESVTFEGRHFGVRFRLTSKITDLERPSRFVDAMQSGPFARMRHDHLFEGNNEGTVMVDFVDFASPFGFIGRIADVFVARHLTRFLIERGRALKRHLEGAG